MVVKEDQVTSISVIAANIPVIAVAEVSEVTEGRFTLVQVAVELDMIDMEATINLLLETILMIAFVVTTADITAIAYSNCQKTYWTVVTHMVIIFHLCNCIGCRIDSLKVAIRIQGFVLSAIDKDFIIMVRFQWEYQAVKWEVFGRMVVSAELAANSFGICIHY